MNLIRFSAWLTPEQKKALPKLAKEASEKEGRKVTENELIRVAIKKVYKI